MRYAIQRNTQTLHVRTSLVSGYSEVSGTATLALPPWAVDLLQGWRLDQSTEFASYEEPIIDLEETYQDAEGRVILSNTDAIVGALAVLLSGEVTLPDPTDAEPIEWEGTNEAWLRHDLAHATLHTDVCSDSPDPRGWARIEVGTDRELEAFMASAKPLTPAPLYYADSTASDDAILEAMESVREAMAELPPSSAVYANRPTRSDLEETLNKLSAMRQESKPEIIDENQQLVDSIVSAIVEHFLREMVDNEDPTYWDGVYLRDEAEDMIHEQCDGALVYTRECEDFLSAFPEHANAWEEVYYDADDMPSEDARAALALEAAVRDSLDEAWETARDNLVYAAKLAERQVTDADKTRAVEYALRSDDAEPDAETLAALARIIASHAVI